MSDPVNPLDQYETYAYQHILYVANTTEGLRTALQDEKIIDKLNKLKRGKSELVSGLVENATTSPGNGKIAMVINSVLDSEFLIDNIKYSSLLMDPVTDFIMPCSTTLVTMTVTEPLGIRFLNVIENLFTNELQCGYDGATFVLQQYFVGHRSDGTTTRYQIPAITLFLSKLTGVFNTSGGAYELEFLGTGGGAIENHRQLGFLPKNFNLTTENQKLVGIVKDLETKLNTLADEDYKAFNKNNKTTDFGRKVGYQFVLPKAWDSYTINATFDNILSKLEETEKDDQEKAQAEAQKKQEEQSAQSTSADPQVVGKTYYNTDVNTRIVDLLRDIFKHSPEVIKAANLKAKQIAENKAKQDVVDDKSKTQDTKTQPALTPEEQAKKNEQDQDSTIAKFYGINAHYTSDDTTVTAHFVVVDYHAVDPEVRKPSKQTLIESRTNIDANITKYKNNIGLIFEYMFSGKNSDIITFDIKFVQGYTFLNKRLIGTEQVLDVNSSANTKASDAKAPNEDVVTNKDKQNNKVGFIRKSDPIYIAAYPASAESGYIYSTEEKIQSRQEYLIALAKFSGMEVLSSSITIRGNPKLYGDVMTRLMPHNNAEFKKICDERQASADAKASSNTVNITSADYAIPDADLHAYLPMFIKVLVYTPRKEFDSVDQTFAEPFWYQGWYRITQVDSVFNDGNFSQKLTLLAYSLYDNYDGNSPL